MSAATPALEANNELTANTRPAVQSPYVGLVPFSERDAEFFFGREKESKKIAGNLRSSRLTLLYGPSGVGKSSVLRAGVFSSLRAIAQRDLKFRGVPDFAVVYFHSWTSDPLEKLSDAIREAVKTSFEQNTIEEIPQTRSLVEIVKTWTERYGIELLIILDQFEEYFLYHEDESSPASFAHELPLVINDPSLRVRFLLSMRDDTLSRLDRFNNSIPNLFDNRLQVDYLDLEAAREAIIQPVRKYNDLYAKENPFIFDHERPDANTTTAGGTEKCLVDEVLKQVQVGKVTIGVTGQGTAKKEHGDDAQAQAGKVAIEAPYLQLVMKRVWHDETTVTTHELKTGTLEKLGGSQKIVEQHLDKFMEVLSEREQEVAASIFYYLVTPSGEKIAHTVKTLAEYTKLPIEEVEPLLEKLLKLSEGQLKVSEGRPTLSDRSDEEEYRILRKVDRNPGKEEIPAYVVYHDALGPAVLAWSEKHKNEQNKKRAETRFRSWMLLIVLIGAAVIAAIIYRNQEQRKFAESVARRQLQEEREDVEALKPYKDTILSLVALQSGSSERKAAAVTTLQQQIESKKLDPDLEPLIRPMLEQIVKAQPQSETGKEAEVAVKQLVQQNQDTRLSPRVYIQMQDEGQFDKAQTFQQQLNTSLLTDIPGVRRIIAPGIQNVGTRRSVTVSELRYFHDTDLENQIGQQLIQILNTAGLTTVHLKLVRGYETNPDIRPNHFELWLAADVR
ncbi:MAG: hypothetical protein V7638_200 [Acidobacteriota bacterium]|jgi:hypothetical protein